MFEPEFTKVAYKWLIDVLWEGQTRQLLVRYFRDLDGFV
jgi:hypothetical protein